MTGSVDIATALISQAPPTAGNPATASQVASASTVFAELLQAIASNQSAAAVPTTTGLQPSPDNNSAAGNSVQPAAIDPGADERMRDGELQVLLQSQALLSAGQPGSQIVSTPPVDSGRLEETNDSAPAALDSQQCIAAQDEISDAPSEVNSDDIDRKIPAATQVGIQHEKPQEPDASQSFVIEKPKPPERTLKPVDSASDENAVVVTTAEPHPAKTRVEAGCTKTEKQLEKSSDSKDNGDQQSADIVSMDTQPKKTSASNEVAATAAMVAYQMAVVTGNCAPRSDATPEMTLNSHSDKPPLVAATQSITTRDGLESADIHSTPVEIQPNLIERPATQKTAKSERITQAQPEENSSRAITVFDFEITVDLPPPLSPNQDRNNQVGAPVVGAPDVNTSRAAPKFSSSPSMAQLPQSNLNADDVKRVTPAKTAEGDRIQVEQCVQVESIEPVERAMRSDPVPQTVEVGTNRTVIVNKPVEFSLPSQAEALSKSGDASSQAKDVRFNQSAPFQDAPQVLEQTAQLFQASDDQKNESEAHGSMAATRHTLPLNANRELASSENFAPSSSIAAPQNFPAEPAQESSLPATWVSRILDAIPKPLQATTIVIRPEGFGTIQIHINPGLPESNAAARITIRTSDPSAHALLKESVGEIRQILKNEAVNIVSANERTEAAAGVQRSSHEGSLKDSDQGRRQQFEQNRSKKRSVGEVFTVPEMDE